MRRTPNPPLLLSGSRAPVYESGGREFNSLRGFLKICVPEAEPDQHGPSKLKNARSIRARGFYLDGITYMKLRCSSGARFRATGDNYSHETHEKTRNIIFIFVPFRGFRGHQYPIKEIKFLY